MQTYNEYEYAYEIIMRIRDLNRDIEAPPPGVEISRERKRAEVVVCEQWLETGRGTPTTKDKAILKYYPLPERPSHVPRGKEKSRRKRKTARILAEIARSAYLTQPDGTSPMTDRQAWNYLPEVADWMLKKHIKCEPSLESRSKAVLIVSCPSINPGEVIEETVTFNQFRKAWEIFKIDPEKRKAAAIKKKDRNEARKVFIRKGVLPKD